MDSPTDIDLSTLPDEIALELKSKNYQRRSRACLDLEPDAQRGSQAVLRVLLQYLRDDHPQVRLSAADALAHAPTDRTAPMLIEYLACLPENLRPGHRASVVHAIGVLSVPCHGPICEALLDELSHPDQDVRFQAMVGLNRIGCTSERFQKAIGTLLDDPDAEVAAVAASAATDFDMTDQVDRIVDRWKTATGFAQRHLALAAAHLGDDRTIETLERAVRTGLDGLEAIEALVSIKSQAAGPILVRLARSWRVHPLLRARAGVALAEIVHPQSNPIIEQHISHRKSEIRWGTIDWIGQLDRQEYVPALIGILERTGHRDAAEAAHALGLMTPNAQIRQVLKREATQAASEEVRQAAAQALRDLDDE